MSFWNSLYLNLKEFRYLFLFGFIVFVFNIFLEYNHFLNLKEETLSSRKCLAFTVLSKT